MIIDTLRQALSDEPSAGRAAGIEVRRISPPPTASP